MKVRIGIDIGGTYVKFGIFSADGALLLHWVTPTNHMGHGEYVLAQVMEDITKKCNELKIYKEDIINVGVAVPGPVRPDGTVEGCVNLEWGTFPLATRFSQMTGLRIIALNDARAAALGEVWQGAAKGLTSALMVTVGTGVGSGVIMDGKIWHGIKGSCGEIGHICIDFNSNIRCSCGNYGCMEQYAAEPAMIRYVKRCLEIGVKSRLMNVELNAKTIINAAKDGDELAVKCVDRSANALGQGIAAANCMIDAEKIVLGGGVMQAGDFYLDKIRAAYQKHAFMRQKETPIVLSALENLSGIYGAAGVALFEDWL